MLVASTQLGQPIERSAENWVNRGSGLDDGVAGICRTGDEFPSASPLAVLGGDVLPEARARRASAHVAEGAEPLELIGREGPRLHGTMGFGEVRGVLRVGVDAG